MIVKILCDIVIKIKRQLNELKR